MSFDPTAPIDLSNDVVVFPSDSDYVVLTIAGFVGLAVVVVLREVQRRRRDRSAG